MKAVCVRADPGYGDSSVTAVSGAAGPRHSGRAPARSGSRRGAGTGARAHGRRAGRTVPTGLCLGSAPLPGGRGCSALPRWSPRMCRRLLWFEPGKRRIKQAKMGYKSWFPVKLCSNPDPVWISPQLLLGNAERFTNGAAERGSDEPSSSSGLRHGGGSAAGRCPGAGRRNPPPGKLPPPLPQRSPGSRRWGRRRLGARGCRGSRGVGGIQAVPSKRARPLVPPARRHCCFPRAAKRGVSRCWGMRWSQRKVN